jgi:hypothetical protein
MPAAALLVHQLRFMLAYGGHAQLALARQGHSYLHSLAPWIVGLVAAAAGGFVWSLGRALTGRRSLSRYALSFAGMWLVCSGCLVGIYVLQELLEGLLAHGHALWLAGVFGYGGWWAIPAAVCIGLVLAAAFHSAGWVLDEVSRRRAPAPADRPVVRPAPRPRDASLPRLAPLAGGCSGRGPPAALARA